MLRLPLFGEARCADLPS